MVVFQTKTTVLSFMLCALSILNPSLPKRQEVARNKYAFHVGTLCTCTYTFHTAGSWATQVWTARVHLHMDFSVNTVSAFSSYRSLNELSVGKSLYWIRDHNMWNQKDCGLSPDFIQTVPASCPRLSHWSIPVFEAESSTRFSTVAGRGGSEPLG